MKNVFYLRLFSLLRYLHFCLDIYMYVKKGLIRRLRVIPKFITLQTVERIITIHILPNISKSKGNQAMEFVQLIEYNVRNIFLQKSGKK